MSNDFTTVGGVTASQGNQKGDIQMNTARDIQNSTPIPFDYAGSPIRTVSLNGEPWFCAPDVCAILGYKNVSKAVNDHCREDGVTKRYATDELRRDQETNFINEGNLYRLIVKSRKAEAESFERWVMETVLPTIRKTGSYAIRSTETDPVLLQLEAIAVIRREQIDFDKRLTLIENERSVAKEAISALPPPTLEVREFTTRETCRLAVDNLASLTGKPHKEIWREAYRQYDVLKRTCLTKMAGNRKLSRIDYIEVTNGLETLYSILQRLISKAQVI